MPVEPQTLIDRDPFAVLGPHPEDGRPGVVIRTRQPAARAVAVRLVASGDLRPMARIDAEGLFEVRLTEAGGGG